MAQEELQVKAVGTTYNVADLGTKPLSRSRITLILYWCNTRNSDDERIGEEEFVKLEENKVNRIKINKLAKLLNRILLFGGLEQATAARSEAVEEVPTRSYGVLILIMVMMLMIAGLAWAVMVAMAIGGRAEGEDRRCQGQRLCEWCFNQSLCARHARRDKGHEEHRGLVKASGYVDKEGVKEEDWQRWNYIKRSNKDFDLRRIHAQIKAYKEECARDEGPTDLRPYRNTEDENVEEEEEESVTVRLESGEVVEITLRFIETREPESEEDAPAAAMEVNEEPKEVEWADEDLPAPVSRIEDPTVNQATSSWITKDDLRALAEYDEPEARSCLRAKQHILKLQGEWTKADREGDHDRKLEIYAMMDVHYPFMDSASLPF